MLAICALLFVFPMRDCSVMGLILTLNFLFFYLHHLSHVVDSIPSFLTLVTFFIRESQYHFE